jgi:predicted TIM-barrel fold metal-dependent hydrolase
MSGEIIDIHPHIIAKDAGRYPPQPIRGLQSEWSKERPQTFEELVAQMDAAGVTKAAIVQASTYYGFDNSYVADSVATDPHRFTGVYSIDVFAPDAIAVLEGWMRRGMGGIRFFTGGSSHPIEADWLDAPETFPAWAFATEKGLPVCVQTTSVGLPKVLNLLQYFPKAKIILDHLARPKLDDGPPYKDARQLFELAVFRNLYLKITPRTFELSKAGKSTPEEFFGALVAAFGADHIAFGSNMPANKGPMRDIVAEAKRCLASLSQADRDMIFSGTAKSLYTALK